MIYYLALSLISTIAVIWLFNYWMAEFRNIIQRDQTLQFAISAVILSGISLVTIIKPFPLVAKFFDDLVLGSPQEIRILVFPLMVFLLTGAYGGLLAGIVCMWRKLPTLLGSRQS
ncbi:hypothetical protein E4188_22745 (plasmid) [Aeromonas media]|uniref:Uncharacterized protein n=1 Tax=Aeromonas media TaxID=651 RepID=A0ABX6NZT6_AERME|nr:hypothetical protein [Aeromonas media]QJT37083.1 hypothetical protein E4187_22595 [Aeromonas media]QJT41318.1 hypothetical protein E4188_22745 [Aeromonas media]